METHHGVRGPCGNVHDRARCERLPLGKNGQKWPKNGVLGLFSSIVSLDFTEIGLK